VGRGAGRILGYSVALVERDTVVGTVVTSGGAPTKTFREAAAYLSSFGKEKVYGIALSAPPEVMYPAIRARARQVSQQFRQAALERIRERGVHLVPGEGRLEAEHTVVARAGGAERRPHAERVIIATGSSPLRPASVPFGDPCVFDSETIAGIAGRPRELLIVGGGAQGGTREDRAAVFGDQRQVQDPVPARRGAEEHGRGNPTITALRGSPRRSACGWPSHWCQRGSSLEFPPPQQPQPRCPPRWSGSAAPPGSGKPSGSSPRRSTWRQGRCRAGW
jgi:hypothetical protein